MRRIVPFGHGCRSYFHLYFDDEVTNVGRSCCTGGSSSPFFFLLQVGLVQASKSHVYLVPEPFIPQLDFLPEPPATNGFLLIQIPSKKA